MPRSTGKIRAEDLDHEAVTSRSFSRTIQSDNFIEGVAGWRIQRDTGNLEVNDGTFRGSVRVFGDDGVTVSGGGDITIRSGGDLIIDGGQVTILAADGVTEKVVLDQSGLAVDGGVVQAVWFTSLQDETVDASLTTVAQEVGSVTVDPPAWVEELTLLGLARASMDNSSGGNQVLVNQMVLDDGGSDEDPVGDNQTIANGFRNTFTLPEELTLTLSPAGRSVVVTQNARVLTGTNGNNAFALKVFAFGVRSAFT